MINFNIKSKNRIIFLIKFINFFQIKVNPKELIIRIARIHNNYNKNL